MLFPLSRMLPRPSGIVALLTDFGSRDPYVGLWKGMLLRAHPKAVMLDLAHDVEARDVALAAFFLGAAIGRFPTGTTFVAVVDPSSAKTRRTLAVVAHDCYWIGPDNGVLGEVMTGVEFEIRHVDFERLGLGAHARSYLGRDAYAPLCGGLAGGRFGYAALGPQCADPVRLPPLLGGPPRVIYVDGHGNLVTNVRAQVIPTLRNLVIGGRSVPVRGHCSDVPPGSLVAIVDSWDLVEIAENQGSAAATLRLGRGAPVALENGSA